MVRLAPPATGGARKRPPVLSNVAISQKPYAFTVVPGEFKQFFQELAALRDHFLCLAAQSFLFVCLVRAMARASAGTSSVTTVPAAT